MVRRRMAAPRPSPPVRSMGRSQASSRTYASPPPNAARTAPPPTPTYAAAPPPNATHFGAAAANTRGPSLMGQMAATAGGVAIGSAVGHAVGNMMTGGGSRAEEVGAPVSSTGVSNPSSVENQPLSAPCEFEWKQFVECTQTQSDVSLCQSLNEAFKQCSARYQ